jgi:predicted nuclease of predicted toxin-antitoxin system
MNFLIDMNLTSRWKEVLENEGHEAAHWSSIGRANTPDSEIMKHAREHDFIVLTQDLDFGAMLANNNGLKPSVIQLRSDNAGPEVIGAQVFEAIRKLQHELESGALVTVDQNKIRLRVLPFRNA